MTSHELAKLLLMGKDMEIGFFVYNGGGEEWQEVKTVHEYDDPYSYPKLELKTY